LIFFENIEQKHFKTLFYILTLVEKMNQTKPITLFLAFFALNIKYVNKVRCVKIGIISTKVNNDDKVFD